MTVQLGVVADDITGACDVAAGLWQEGLTAEVRLGVPDPSDSPRAGVACVVVALKSRTAPVAAAVADSVRSARALRRWGAAVIYQKYCSTFDSTDEGTVGPVADALLDEIGEHSVSLGTPVTPAAGRTMHRGHLFVGDRLLSESSMARHPLTPMTDSDLVRVLSRQTPRPVTSIGIGDVRAGSTVIAERIAQRRAEGARHVLFDAVEDADLDAIAAAVAGVSDAVIGGAAGLVTALARQWARRSADLLEPAPEGRRLILSGSGSARTREQVAAYAGPVFPLGIGDLAADAGAVIAEALEVIADDEPVLVTATADPDRVAEVQRRWGAAQAAQLIESTLARIAAAAVADHGVRRLIVAGGETSGAVAAALRLGALTVRRVAAPGVPWMTATDAAGHRLDVCFKSGNFGRPTLFSDAWQDPAP